MNLEKIRHDLTTNKEKSDSASKCVPTQPKACERCGGSMKPEHAHFKCAQCGWLTHCCEGGQG